jgi:hypothetical protein
MAGVGMAPEVSELADVIDRLGRRETPPATRSDGTPCGPPALTLSMVRAETGNIASSDLYTWLADRKNRRTIPHRLASCGYLPAASAAPDRLWIIQGRRHAVYTRHDLNPAERLAAAEKLKARLDQVSTTVTSLKREDRQPKKPATDAAETDH